jgi:hypothetical protein
VKFVGSKFPPKIGFAGCFQPSAGSSPLCEEFELLSLLLVNDTVDGTVEDDFIEVVASPPYIAAMLLRSRHLSNARSLTIKVDFIVVLLKDGLLAHGLSW